MIRRNVVFSPEARSDLQSIYDWIARAASPDVALEYLERVEAFLKALESASERGTRHDDIRKGLRTVGFERRITVAFTVSPSSVVIQRLFYAGRNWVDELS